jgi:hypothetical protein
MNDKKIFLGCFVSGPAVYGNDDQSKKDAMISNGRLFCSYVTSNSPLGNAMAQLESTTYGLDLSTILFQFYLNPIPFELEHLKEIENYRKKEKAIGIPIIVNLDIFFGTDENGRLEFLKNVILQKLDLLGNVAKKKKLDINIEKLKSDLKNSWQGR